jgi:hypothetical protein
MQLYFQLNLLQYNTSFSAVGFALSSVAVILLAILYEIAGFHLHELSRRLRNARKRGGERIDLLISAHTAIYLTKAALCSIFVLLVVQFNAMYFFVILTGLWIGHTYVLNSRMTLKQNSISGLPLEVEV